MRPSAEFSDLGSLLDDEIDRLPERFRLPFLLIHLHGRSHEEAAQELAVPKGTLLSRLAPHRQKLRFRLSRRGVSLGTAGLMACGAATEELSAALVSRVLTTISSSGTATAFPAVALMEGVQAAMFVTKIKIAAGVLLVAATFGGGTLLACHRRCWPQPAPCLPVVCVAPAPEPPPVAEKPAEPKKAEPPPLPPDRLTQILMDYERKQSARTSAHGELTRIELDNDGTVTIFKGEFRYLTPDYAAVQLVNVDNRNIWETRILHNGRLYDYRPQVKSLMISEMRADPSRTPIETALGWRSLRVGKWNLFSPPSLLKIDPNPEYRQVDVRLMKDVSDNQPYVYLEILPKTKEARREFLRSQLVIVAETGLLRRIWIAFGNGNEVTFDFTEYGNVQLKPTDFVAPSAPPGWKVEEIPLAEPKPASGTPNVPRGFCPRRAPVFGKQ